jgi:hypothetical protein
MANVDPEALLQPIAGGAGPDPTYDLDFEWIANGLRGSNVHDSAPEWEWVKDDCERLLLETAKDLRVACYYTMALAHCQGMLGLYNGLRLLRELCHRFGSELHPLRARTRRGALAWFDSALTPVLPQLRSPPRYGQVKQELLAFIDAVTPLLTGTEADTAAITATKLSFDEHVKYLSGLARANFDRERTLMDADVLSAHMRKIRGLLYHTDKEFQLLGVELLRSLGHSELYDVLLQGIEFRAGRIRAPSSLPSELLHDLESRRKGMAR